MSIICFTVRKKNVDTPLATFTHSLSCHLFTTRRPIIIFVKKSYFTLFKDWPFTVNIAYMYFDIDFAPGLY
jgi:hypothetical protein